ncbi:MAG: hypothetical protein ACK2UM_04840 [Anaerolineales bacterium]|jgi:hypothetical protein
MSDEDISTEGREPIEVITNTRPQNKPRVGTFRMLMRMALGGVVIGREELINRFQERQSESHISAMELNRVAPIESEGDRVRYAVVGAISDSSTALRKNISKLSQASDRSYGRMSRAIQPVTNSRLLKPFRHRYQRFLDRGDEVVSAWIAAGRKEEYLGRELAQQSAIETIEETLDYLAISPEMDELMTTQSIDLVDDILIDNIREGASNSTLILTEWFNTRILRRKRKIEVEPTGSSSGENTQGD